ncbi:MAG TPA: CerR family C-terminal domain-containing protein [Verrucomicrobiae bacterium]
MRVPAFFSPGLSKRDRARLKLLEAAVRIFGRKGPDGATVREIARAAGQNVAAIAYYFGGKQKLYDAVMEGILRELWQRLGDLPAEVANLQQQREPAPAEAARLLSRLLSAIYVRLLSRDDAVAIVQLVVREQLGPTSGFETLYRRGFRVLHEALCFLAGVALGRDPRDPETIVRTHTLMGQVYFFAMSREAALRRLGWKSLEGKNAELVVRVLEQNLETLFAGLPRARAGSRVKGGARDIQTQNNPKT